MKLKNKESSKHTYLEEEVVSYAQRWIHALVMWYLPMIDYLRFLFTCPKDDELMCWHASDECKKDNGKLRHPANVQQWKILNDTYSEFAKESTNVMFTLSANRMNPFHDRRSKHNIWLVILTIYNLPS